MGTSARYPTDHEPELRVGAAVGHFSDLATVIGTQRPGAAGCWCMAYRNSRVPALERPAFMENECATEPGPGVLLYVDDVAAGWCSIAPRQKYQRLLRSRTIPMIDERDVWVAVCFVIRPGFRRHGLMHSLLGAAVAHAGANGAEVVEGYPVEASEERVDVISGYVGTVALFERAGFERAAPTTGRSGGRPRWVMRKVLREVRSLDPS